MNSWESLPIERLKSLTPYKSEMVHAINFPSTDNDNFAGSDMSEFVAALFESYLTFPIVGIYEFCMSSDDGSILYFDDVEIINNDG